MYIISFYYIENVLFERIQHLEIQQIKLEHPYKFPFLIVLYNIFLLNQDLFSTNKR